LAPSTTSARGAKRQHAATRRQRHRNLPRSRRSRANWRLRFVVASVLAVFVLTGWAVMARRSAPVSNTNLQRFDAIIVLGFPADYDGNPTPTQLARVTEAVREYERGVAPRLILTGGATSRNFVEADVMARTAEAQGVPATAIFKESRAHNTIENACYATRIMRNHGWKSAEVVSSGYHLPRAAMIFGQLPLEWRVHAAPPLEPQSILRTGKINFFEMLSTMRYLAWARAMDQCQP
jgi:uncharacterized SAM-binding protein YcdF (DUF218 family)